MNDTFDLVDQISIQSPDAKIVSDDQASVVLMHGFQSATEGIIAPSRYLRLGLCISAGGSVSLGAGKNARQLPWRKNNVFVTTPSDNTDFASPNLNMIGLAIDLQHPDYEYLKASAGSLIVDRPSFVIDDDVVNAVLRALWISAEKHQGSDLFVQQGVALIIQRITGTFTPQQERPKIPPLSQRQLERVGAYVDAHMGGKLRIQDIAAVVGLPDARFSEAIKATTGLTPFAYLTSRRLERAKVMIESGETITQTALAVGYTNPSKFAAAFKRFVGCTPTKWRQNDSG